MICKNVPLKKYNTFGLEYNADCMIHLRNENEATEIFKGFPSWNKQSFIIGGGSNILFVSDFKGTIIHPRFKGIKIEEQQGDYAVISAGAGLSWDFLVEWTVKKGFGGLENLSLIPGKVGATPVQNIGAYGVEAKDVIERVKTININDGSIRFFSNSECDFSYRNSIFKNQYKGIYLVVCVYYKLNTNPKLNLSYGSLKDEVSILGGETLMNVRQAVINIRRSKLPAPEIMGNAGSFFKNPVITEAVADSLRNMFPDMPYFADSSGLKKLSAGWLIEQCGWKGKRYRNAGVHDRQALVIVNLNRATGKEILQLSEMIQKSVSDKFGINLEREVELVGVI